MLFASLKPRIKDQYTVAYIRRDQDLGLIGSLEKGLNEQLIPGKNDKASGAENIEVGIPNAEQLKEAISNLEKASGKLSEADIELGLDKIIEQLSLLLPSSQSRFKAGLAKWRAIEAIMKKGRLKIPGEEIPVLSGFSGAVLLAGRSIR